MNRTLELRLTLNEDTLRRALTIVHDAGFTPEALMVQVLERCARDGEIPLSRPRPRKKAAYMQGVFSQGSLFGSTPEDGTASPEGVLVPVRDVAPAPTLKTLTALQEAQAMLRWRERERRNITEETASTARAGGLTVDRSAPLALLETHQFRQDKQAILTDPEREKIIHALEVVFAVLTHRRTPESALALTGGESPDEYVVPLAGLAAPRVLIYQRTPAEVCCVRYGDPRELLDVVPEALTGEADQAKPAAKDDKPAEPVDLGNLPTVPPLSSLFGPQ